MFIDVPYTDEKGNRKYKTANTDLIKFIEDEEPFAAEPYQRKGSILVFTDGTRFRADDDRYWMQQRLNYTK